MGGEEGEGERGEGEDDEDGAEDGGEARERAVGGGFEENGEGKDN